MKFFVAMGVLSCLLAAWVQAVAAAPFELPEVPDYQALLRPEPLTEREKLLQQVAQGRLRLDPVWAWEHPQEAEILFEEILSDQVMSESLHIPGFLPNAGWTLAGLSLGSGSGRLGGLLGNYLKWQQGRYDWYEGDDDLEGYLGVGLSAIESQRDRERDRLDSQRVTLVSVEAGVEIDLDMLPEQKPEPHILARWSRMLTDGMEKETAGDAVSALRFARSLPYPAMEIQALLRLSRKLMQVDAVSEAETALKQALELAMQQGFEGLAAKSRYLLNTLKSNASTALLSYEQDIRKLADSPMRDSLLLSLVREQLRHKDLRRAQELLQELVRSKHQAERAEALMIALHVGYPFAFSQLLTWLSGPDRELKLAALKVLETGHITAYDLDQAGTESAAGPSPSQQMLDKLLVLLKQNDPEIQGLALEAIDRLLPYGQKPSVDPKQFMALLASDEPEILLPLLSLLFKLPEDARSGLRKRLPTLAEHPTLRSHAVLLAQMFKEPLPFEALKSQLTDFQNIYAWTPAFEVLALADQGQARQQLKIVCAEEKALPRINCLYGQLILNEASFAPILVQTLDKGLLRNTQLYGLSQQLQPAHMALLADLLGHASPRVRQGALSLIHQTRSDQPERARVLAKARSLLQDKDRQTRLLALDVFLSEQETISLQNTLASPDLAQWLLGIYHMHTRSAVVTELPKPSAERVLALLKQPDQPLPPAVSGNTLGLLKDWQGLTLHQALAQVLKSRRVFLPALSEKDLVSLLSHSEPRVRGFAIERLKAAHGPKYLSAFRKLLQDPDAEVAGAAYQAILVLYGSRLGDLVGSLADPDSGSKDLPERLKLAMEHPIVLREVFASNPEHLQSQPLYQQALRRALFQASDIDTLHAVTGQLAELDPPLSTDELAPLLRPETPANNRAAAVGLLNLLPPSPKGTALLRSLHKDVDPMILLALLVQGMHSKDSAAGRELLLQLAPAADYLIDFNKLILAGGFEPDFLEGAGRTIETYVANYLSHSLPASDPETLRQWQNWSKQAPIPTSWKKAIEAAKK